MPPTPGAPDRIRLTSTGYKQPNNPRESTACPSLILIEFLKRLPLFLSKNQSSLFPDVLMATEGLQFSAWHPLLVRTLKLVLEDAKLLSGCRSGTLLAVLVRIPIPPESVPYFDQVLRLLGQYINSISVTEALRSTCYVACQYPEDLVYLTGTSKTVTVR